MAVLTVGRVSWKNRMVIGMRTIVCFGDSLIQGFPYTCENSWVAQVERRTGIKMLNYGLCGDCCDDIFDRLRYGYLPDQVDHILFLGGANDILQGRPREHILNDYQRLINWCQEKAWLLCIVLPLLTTESAFNVPLQGVRDDLQKQFSSSFLLDLQPAIGFSTAALASAYLDGIHPLAKTYTALGDYAAGPLAVWMHTGK